MSVIKPFVKNNLFQSWKPVFQISKAFLNARRKAIKTRFCLEPKRRLSVIFENPNTHNALRNGPDYSFLDNRPTPYGVQQYKRICQSIEHTAAIIQQNKEIELAIELEKKKKSEEEARIQDILGRKLKPKGGTITIRKEAISGDENVKKFSGKS